MGRTVPKFSVDKARQVAEATLAMIKTADKVGVNIAYGTDCPFEVQLAEFELRKAILPSATVLQHATCNAGACRVF
jgi:imidazolonepropionase-like amidohydrolase